MSIKILIADDHQIVRDGLRALIEKSNDMKVVAEAQDGRHAIQLAGKLSPDVVVMDVGMPELNGIEATRHILADNSDIKVVALSMHSDKRFVAEMLKAGASGYLLKDTAFEELAHAIRTVARGQIYLSPQIAEVVTHDYIQQLVGQPENAFTILTNREREILQLIAEGKSTKKIAEQLHISIKTVEAHRQNIMRKLSIHTVPELTKYAIREGLTSLEL